MQEPEEINQEDLIIYYFDKNFTYQEIIDLLSTKHHVQISLSTLKRILSDLELKRKNFQESNLKSICAAIVEELMSCGYNLGYRSLWQKLKKKYGLKVKRETVYRILQVADPEGIANRFGNKLKRRTYLRPGPNFMWHLDGYDKLKQFGFAIHGCIDGFSRYIIWLDVATTNNNPSVTAYYYYLKSIENLKLLPTVIRCDRGSENTLIGSLQTCLRKKHDDVFAGDASFIQGKSTRNQRIESFWGRMRNHSMDFYIQFFKNMQNKNLFDGSALHVKCLQFSFGPLLKYDLLTTKELWNEHSIRKQAIRNNLSGKPYVLYNLPEKYGAKDYKKDVNSELVKELTMNFTIKPQLVDPDFEELVELLLPEVRSTATTPEDALLLYTKIINSIENYKKKN